MRFRSEYRNHPQKRSQRYSLDAALSKSDDSTGFGVPPEATPGHVERLFGFWG
jgi:hypothetical protein